MKRAALEATLARLHTIKNDEIIMDRYGYIVKGVVENPGCLAQQVVMANLPEVPSPDHHTYGMGTGNVADKILNLSTREHEMLFLSKGTHYEVAYKVDRSNVINVVQRILDTGVINWRPEAPQFTIGSEFEPLTVTLE